MIFEAKFQIGKNGISPGTIESLNLYLKTHNQIRISVLKSAERVKAKIKEMAEEISNKIEYNSRHKIIGFTIILRKSGKKKKI